MWCVRRVKKNEIYEWLVVWSSQKKKQGGEEEMKWISINCVDRMINNIIEKRRERMKISDDDIDDFEVSWNCHNNLIKAMFRKKML